ncbi:hypothetical protein P7K49_026486 [Saguinus oedipus]|uniref:Uncharacterized protein n=1 Tax=Saguinus oedipus TaxID=9490 RepID=A0ABQ9UE95_SAGOE|nr:hypothetical protein P7K49_026486 [Saguinus oedipus]
MHASDSSWTLTRARNLGAGGVTLEKQHPSAWPIPHSYGIEDRERYKRSVCWGNGGRTHGRSDISEMSEIQGTVSPAQVEEAASRLRHSGTSKLPWRGPHLCPVSPPALISHPPSHQLYWGLPGCPHTPDSGVQRRCESVADSTKNPGKDAVFLQIDNNGMEELLLDAHPEQWKSHCQLRVCEEPASVSAAGQRPWGGTAGLLQRCATLLMLMEGGEKEALHTVLSHTFVRRAAQGT